MVSKRLAGKLTASSKKTITGAKRRVGDLNLEGKVQSAADAAKSTASSADTLRSAAQNKVHSAAYAAKSSAPSADDIRNSVQDRAKAVGKDILQRRDVADDLAAIALALKSVVSDVEYADLSARLQGKFERAGLGGDRGYRISSEAQSFYESTVPDAVKMQGEDAIWEFLNGKDASHIKSFENSPELVKTDSNFVWEGSSSNRARGSADMTAFEQMQINLSNGFESFAVVAKDIVPQAVFYGAAIEAAISIIENSIYVYRGHKDVRTALQDTAKNVARGAIMGLVAGTVISGLAVLGAAPLLAAVAPVLAVVGGALLVYSAARRIHTALTYESPGAHGVNAADGIVIDSYVVRNADEQSNEDLLAPLNGQLESLRILKEEILSSIPKEQIRQLSAVRPSKVGKEAL